MSEQSEAVVRREVYRLVDDEEDELAAAVIRDYGDKRYQQAIADVVEWLGERARICDDWEWEEDWIEADACRKAASQITRRFGKDRN